MITSPPLSPCRSLIGTPIFFLGRIWIIEEINYLNDYDVVRYDATRRVWQYTNISGTPLPDDHAHHWFIPAPDMIGKFRRPLNNASRLNRESYPAVSWHQTAKKWRRRQYWRNILKRFFARVQRRGRHLAFKGFA